MEYIFHPPSYGQILREKVTGVRERVSRRGAQVLTTAVAPRQDQVQVVVGLEDLRLR
jgi:hypothetical protein